MPDRRLGIQRIAAMILALVPAAAGAICGELIELSTHASTTTRYALAMPPAGKAHAVLLLLAGGSGRITLGQDGCAHNLRGNSLVRSQPLFLARNLATAYVDAPSDFASEDGLAGFRTEAAHAEDLGKVVVDLRRRTGLPVWVVGTSRGAISAANAASRLRGQAAADGAVLTSPVTVGNPNARVPWVRQSTLDLPLEEIHVPLLLVGHAEDHCARSPASMLERIAERAVSTRKQVVIVTGGPGSAIAPGVAACEAHSPHGFLEQEEAVADGIDRFIRGERY